MDAAGSEMDEMQLNGWEGDYDNGFQGLAGVISPRNFQLIQHLQRIYSLSFE